MLYDIIIVFTFYKTIGNYCLRMNFSLQYLHFKITVIFQFTNAFMKVFIVSISIQF